jgi:geranylgeranyl diphosphate synthase, type I
MDSDALGFIEGKKAVVDAAIGRYLPKDFSEKYVSWLLGKPTYAYTTAAVQKALADPVHDFLSRGGKRWRPALFLLFTEALGGDQKKVQDFVVTLELLHEGSIMVDDVEDNSDLRRDKPCTHKLFGVDVAINAGNFMYFLAFAPMIRNVGKFPEKTVIRAYNAALEEMIRIHYGQGTDIAWHNGLADADRISEDEYLQMCAYKTGVLARLAARLAVILTDGSEDLETKLGRFSESIGVAFQIQDDILNIAPGKGWGKEVGDDINEGKRTLLIIHTLSKASPADRKRLIAILGMHTKDHKLIAEAIGIIVKYGSVDYAKAFARDMVKKAWKDVEPLIPKGQAKEKLRAFADFMVEREI